MEQYNQVFVLYGLEHYTAVINNIIDNLGARDCEFDIKMILTEAIANAYFHGNNSNDSKPIYVRYVYDGSKITFEIEDCGTGTEDILQLQSLEDVDPLSEGNRGLFLISCYAEKIEYHNHILKIEKTYNKIN